MKPKEAKARIKINKLLESAGWRFFDDENGPANIQVELNVKMTKSQVDAYGEDFDKTKNGFVDFLLLNRDGKPYIVLEAKAEDKDPLIGKEQAREYAQSLFVKFVFLSNGNQHYFWNIERGNPQIITAFPSYDSLKDSKAMNADPSKLYNEEILEDYIAVVKNARYAEAPEYIDKSTRSQYLINNKLRMLRSYQINALKAIQESVKKGNQRFLFEMATGTGKTLTAAAVIKLFLRSGNANRVLFLVDRIELENQAKKNFTEYLYPDYNTVTFKENTDDWHKAEIVVSTVQTLMSNNKYKTQFSPTDFSLIIADESHRSINGNNRALFEYFIGYKLGLTATPKDYLKNVDINKIKSSDPRAWEKRQLLDSYKTFGCESGDPTYRYSLTDGVGDKFLINPYVLDARTNITTELLAEEGYAVIGKSTEIDEESEETYFARDFEKKFFSDETNKMFVKTFMDRAKCDPISGEIGKGIIFCVSRKHAAKITQLLNVYAEGKFPGKYNSDFALQITSDILNAQQYTTNFVNNNLNGHTSFLDGYRSSKTRICVTVGMMTTGYDCQDLLNIGLMRPIFSPTDFIQIKGRGTRKFTFTENKRDGMNKVEKDNFYLFDFFGNCEYFEEKFNYDEEIKLPIPQKDSYDIKTGSTKIEGFENISPDPIKSIKEMEIGSEGMKVDRIFFDKFEEEVKQNEIVKEQYDQGNYSAVIAYIDEHIMNKPNEFYTWDKLKRSIGVDRRISSHEIIDKIFGVLPFFKNKKELIEDEFERYQQIIDIPQEKYYEVKEFFSTYLLDKAVRRAIEDENYQAFFADINTLTMDDIKDLGKEYMLNIVEYINDNIRVSKFT